VKDNDYDFQQQSAKTLTSFHGNIHGFQTILEQLGADKGMANYDPSNCLQTLLENFVNLQKNTLSYINVLCYNIPILGPILGPSKHYVLLYYLSC
jgi:hypothetical protein